MRARVRCSCALITGLSMALSTSRNRSWAKPSGASASAASPGPGPDGLGDEVREASCPLTCGRGGRGAPPPRRRRRREQGAAGWRDAGQALGERLPHPARNMDGLAPEDRPAAASRLSSRTNNGLPPARRTRRPHPPSKATGGDRSARSAAFAAASPPRLTTSTPPVSRTTGVEASRYVSRRRGTPARPHVTGEEVQQLQPLRVGPLQVVEHDHEHPVACQPGQCAGDRVEQREALRRVWCRAAWLSARGGCSSLLAGASASGRVRPAGPRAAPARRANTAVQPSPPSSAPTARPRRPDGLVRQGRHQGRLADAGLAGDQHGTPPAGEGGVERGAEPPKGSPRPTRCAPPPTTMSLTDPVARPGRPPPFTS